MSDAQLFRLLGGPAFYTVSSKTEIKVLPAEFGIDAKSIAINASATAALESFDIVFNIGGNSDLAIAEDVLYVFGFYVHYKGSD